MRGIGLLACLLACCGGALAAAPGKGEDRGKTVVYRDTWGVPHIYAPTAEAGLYAMGWAQAEDRPEELLKNFARGIGISGLFDGEDALQSDLRAQLFDHYGVSQRLLDTLDPTVRSEVEAYVRGVNAFYAAHPADLPAWWGGRQLDAAMVIAFGRMFLYNWSIDDGYDDLRRGGVEPGYDRELRGSNQWSVSPARSAAGAAMLTIDPHLAWFGPSRFWEFRIHAGALEGSGFTLPGVPYIGLGHNADVAWAMTTGGPDTADIFTLELNPDNPLQYTFDGQWIDMTVRMAQLPQGGKTLEKPIYDTRFGPVVAVREGKAYALRTAYADCVKLNEAWRMLNTARDYRDAIAALDMQQFFPQNVMCADQQGNLYYQRTGRVPRRPAGIDCSKPIDGSTSANDWQGLHPQSDLVQVLNPASGYMQNCNIPPDAMIVSSPLQPDKYPGYIFSDLSHGPRGGWSNERGARALELLSNDESVTIDEMKAITNDIRPYSAPRWIALLGQAHAAHPERHADPDYAAAVGELFAWNFELERDSTAALKYFYWRRALREALGDEAADALGKTLDAFYANAVPEAAPALAPSAEVLAAASAAAAGVLPALRADYGRGDATYGDRFRVGRDDASWPLAGGGDTRYGLRTLRSVGYDAERPGKTQWGRNGQTSPQVVVMTQPVQSWTMPPIGQSDRPDSPHYRDQAEKTFGPRTMKPTWWTPKELKHHIESRTVLEFGDRLRISTVTGLSCTHSAETRRNS